MLPVAPNGTGARCCLQIGCQPAYHASTSEGETGNPHFDKWGRFIPYNAPRVSKDGARRHLSKNEIRLCVCAGENGEIDPHSADQARLRGGRQGAGLIPKRPPWLALFLQSENHKRQVDVIASGDDSHRAPCLCEVNRAGTGSVSFWPYGSIRQSPPSSRGN